MNYVKIICLVILTNAILSDIKLFLHLHRHHINPLILQVSSIGGVDCIPSSDLSAN